eukprot:403336927
MDRKSKAKASEIERSRSRDKQNALTQNNRDTQPKQEKHHAKEAEEENDFIDESNQDIKIFNIENCESAKVIILSESQCLKFQGAAKLRVLHGIVNIFGALLTPENTQNWVEIISDPRKGMQLKAINQTQSKQLINQKFDVDSHEVKIKVIQQNYAVVALKEFTQYSQEESQYFLESDDQLMLQNFTIQEDPVKGYFNFNKSYATSLSKIKELSSNKSIIILINGVQNSGKSTFISCLANQFQSLRNHEVYLLDADPGQPNFTLAGQVSLSKINDLILTNQDFTRVEKLKSIFINNSSPQMNINYYVNAVADLMEVYHNQPQISKIKNRVLLVNTCGWVEGLGSMIQMQSVKEIRPNIVVTMQKQGQGLKDNDFSGEMRTVYDSVLYLDIDNDIFEGQQNSKGSVQRNRKLINSLTELKEDRYLFKQNLIDNQTKQAVSSIDNQIKCSDLIISKTQSFRLSSRKSQEVSFAKISFILGDEFSDYESKIQVLRQFNGQVAAFIKLNETSLKDCQKLFNDVKISKIDMRSKTLPAIELKFYGLIKDVDFTSGLHVIPQNNQLDISQVYYNAIMIVDEHVFRISQSSIVQEDFQEVIIQQEVTKQVSGIFENNPIYELQYFQADLMPIIKE